MNEVENMVINEEIENVSVTEIVPEEASSGSALGTLVKVGLVVGATALVGFVVKKSKKFRDWQFKKACKTVEANGCEVVRMYDELDEADVANIEEIAE